MSATAINSQSLDTKAAKADPKVEVQLGSSLSYTATNALPGIMPVMPVSEADKFRRIAQRAVRLPLVMGAVGATLFIVYLLYLISVSGWVDHTHQAIGRFNELTTLQADMQSALRGFVNTGDNSTLSPFQIARPQLDAQLTDLTRVTIDNPPQTERLRRITALQTEWNVYADRVIAAQKGGEDALALARAGSGRQLFDQVRSELLAGRAMEQDLLKERLDHAGTVTLLGFLLSVGLFAMAAVYVALSGRRDIDALAQVFSESVASERTASAALTAQAWALQGQSQLARELIGLETSVALGQSVVEFVVRQLAPTVAAMYVYEQAGMPQRIATYGFNNFAHTELIAAAQSGLVGQVSKDGQLKHVKNLEAGFFKVRSGLVEGDVAELVVAPLSHAGHVRGVIELGFLRPVQPRDLELLNLIAGSVGASIDATMYRRRLQESLEQMQSLNEELQTQQEELRVANEELEVLSHVLRDRDSKQ